MRIACGKSVSLHPYSYPIMSEYFTISVHLKSDWGRRGRDRMVVEFTTTCRFSTYRH